MEPIIIDSLLDLLRWLDAQTGGTHTLSDLLLLARGVQDADGCPKSGQDWAEFLDTLPSLGVLLRIEHELADLHSHAGPCPACNDDTNIPL